VPLVLKLTPETALADAEVRALQAWQSSGRVPAVWGSDLAAGAVLLEAIQSETPLAEADEPRAIESVAELIGALHRSAGPPVANGTPALTNRVEFIFRHWIERHSRNPATADVVVRLKRGHRLARALALDEAPRALLHGDLHPGNVLDGGAERGLVAIDPRACIGDPAFDAVDWVFWRTDDPAVWEQRVHLLAAALDATPDRVRDWCAAFAALLAAGAAARDGSRAYVEALLELAP
jgi:streptomycin 6-kinase